MRFFFIPMVGLSYNSVAKFNSIINKNVYVHILYIRLYFNKNQDNNRL